MRQSDYEEGNGVKKIVIVACGTHRASGYSCPGEWRCLKAAALGQGNFGEPSQVIAFVSCECPGHTVIPTLVQSEELSGIRPDAVHISTCLTQVKPKCPYRSPEDLARLIENKTGIPVILGSHPYPHDGQKQPPADMPTEVKKMFRR